jgi:hypothetical protein
MPGSNVSTSVLGMQNAHGLEGLIRARQIAGDRITICLGAVLTVCAVALPVYVIQTSDGRPDVQTVLPSNVANIPVNRGFAAGRGRGSFGEPETTGAVSKEVAGGQEDQRTGAGTGAGAPDMQPKRYVVRGVSDGVALVEGPEGLWAVVPGAKLPGAGRIQSIEKSGKGWIVVTSETTIRQSSL